MKRLEVQRKDKGTKWHLVVDAETPKDDSLSAMFWEFVSFGLMVTRVTYHVNLSDEEANKLLTIVARNGANRIEERYGDIKLLDGLIKDPHLQFVLPACVRLLCDVRKSRECTCDPNKGSWARLHEREPPTTPSPPGDGDNGPAGSGARGGIVAPPVQRPPNAPAAAPLATVIYGAAAGSASLVPGEALYQEPAPGPGDGGEAATVDDVIAYQIGEGVSRVDPVTDDISVAYGMGGEGADKVRGIVVGTAVLPVRLPANTRSNAEAAIKKRGEKVPAKARVPQPVHLSLIAIERYLKENVFTVEAFDTFLEKQLSPEHLASKKWDHSRFKNAMHNLISHAGDPWVTTLSPALKQDAMMKNEMAKEGKSFRVVINHGDEGQVFGLLLNSFIEDAFFTRFVSQTIKKADKVTAMRRVSNTLRQKVPCSAVELDGSAWDWCCNARVREFENNLYNHAACIVEARTAILNVFSQRWTEYYLTYMNQEVTQLKMPKGEQRKNVYKRVNQVRDSGDRGTSVKNGILNFGLTIATLADPADAVEVFTTGYGRMQTGEYATVRNCHEGDDTGLTISPVQAPDSKLLKLQERNWRDCGFAMKIKLVEPGEALEFCGWKMLVDRSGPTLTMGPDLPRNLGKLNVLTSPAAINAFNKERGTVDVGKVRGLHNSKMLALALNCAPTFPSVSNAMLARFHEAHAATPDEAFKYKVDPTMDLAKFGPAGISKEAADSLVKASMIHREDEFLTMGVLFGGTAAEWESLCLRL